MIRIIALMIATLLALVAIQYAQASPSGDYNPPDDYQAQLLEVGAPADWPNWKRAMVRWDSLEWFQANCLSGTIPWPSRGRSHVKVEGKGEVWRLSSDTTAVEPFPLAAFTYAGHGKGSEYMMGLTDEGSGRMGFGAYCMYVSPTIEVRLTCELINFINVGLRGYQQGDRPIPRIHMATG